MNKKLVLNPNSTNSEFLNDIFPKPLNYIESVPIVVMNLTKVKLPDFRYFKVNTVVLYACKSVVLYKINILIYLYLFIIHLFHNRTPKIL